MLTLDEIKAQPLAITGAAKIHETREGWLRAAIAELTPVFAEIGMDVPAVQISVGFPGGGSRRSRIGECWPTSAAKDGLSHLYVSPVLEDRVDVLATLAHELIHAADNCASGHRGAFRKYATAVGLKGKMTATVPGAALRETLERIATTLGAYPHGAVRTPGAKGKGRMMKMECGECGFITYTSRKWLEQYDGFVCPCGGHVWGA